VFHFYSSVFLYDFNFMLKPMKCKNLSLMVSCAPVMVECMSCSSCSAQLSSTVKCASVPCFLQLTGIRTRTGGIGLKLGVGRWLPRLPPAARWQLPRGKLKLHLLWLAFDFEKVTAYCDCCPGRNQFKLGAGKSLYHTLLFISNFVWDWYLSHFIWSAMRSLDFIF